MILKTAKGKIILILPFLYALYLRLSIVHKERFFYSNFCVLKEVFHLTNEDGLISLEYHHFATPIEIIDLGKGH